MELTKVQLQTLRHMLGINTPASPKPVPYRDYYCAPKNFPPLQELERLGMVRMYRQDSNDWYTCTPQGKQLAINSHKSIRYSKSKRIYLTFLDVKDALCDLTFKQFITDPQFRETRRNA